MTDCKHKNKYHTIPIRNVKDISRIIIGSSHMMTLTLGEQIKNIVKEYLE